MNRVPCSATDLLQELEPEKADPGLEQLAIAGELEA